MSEILIVDFWPPDHGRLMKEATEEGAGKDIDISHLIDIYGESEYSFENVVKGIRYAKENNYKLVAYSGTGATPYLGIAREVYPVTLFIPAGANWITQRFYNVIPEIICVTGAGDSTNETAFNVEFISNDPITPETIPDEQDLSSFTMICGQIFRIMLERNCSAWEARWCAMRTGSRNGIWHEQDGYGHINVQEAIDYTGDIMPDPFNGLNETFFTYDFVEGKIKLSFFLHWEIEQYSIYRKFGRSGNYKLIGTTTEGFYIDGNADRTYKDYYYKITGQLMDGRTVESDELAVPFYRIDELFI